jgi:hypothetical protein
MTTYWKVVCTGTGYRGYSGPTGPWTSEEMAQAAYDRWFRFGGWQTNPDAYDVRIVGPFPSPAAAHKATIADYADYLVRSCWDPG